MIEAETIEGTLVLTINSSALDAANAVSVKKAMQEAIEAPGGAVVVDLKQVALIDSTGVGLLLGISKYNEAKIGLRNVRPEVMGVLTLLRLQKVFEIEGG
ncbi:STAS domain-containing protein [Cerasicoccus maritimus]|uniref:STAS domain-containing protein n=1 Tax=Cerasicoccus maritimus TaxID=490089 RepID=UPI002852D86A|nr:STAS domain-containing protein [Cerasicoccus maritimus]